MSQTTVSVELKDSGYQPLNGYVMVKLDYPLTNDAGQTFEPFARNFTLDNAGKTTLTLEASDVAKVSYYFEVHVVDPVTLADTRLDYFHAIIPASLVPIKFTSLAQQVGVTKDNQDASIVAIIRRMLSLGDFWAGISTNTFRPKGEYSSTAYYSAGDIVVYNGNGYMNISLSNQAGIAPTVTTNWQPIVYKGTTGSGTTGDPAPYSTATWTDNIAPARVAVKNIIQTLATTAQLASSFVDTVLTGSPTATGSLAANDNSARLATTQWVQALIQPILNALTPVGTVVSYIGTSAPTGWMFLDGRVLTQSSYTNLFNLIGTSYNTGGETSSQFRIPDLRGRTVFAPDAMGINGSGGRISPANTLASSGGAQLVTLALSQVPAHSHNLTNPTGILANAYTTGAIAGGTSTTAGTLNTAVSSNTTASQGGGGSHENMPPYLTLNYIVYVGQ